MGIGNQTNQKISKRFFDIEKGKDFKIIQSLILVNQLLCNKEVPYIVRAQGTDNLLRQSSTYINNKGLLIRSKTKSDLRADLPTIN